VTTSGTAPFECPDEIATGEMEQVKACKSIKRDDIPFALRRGTIGQVTTHHHLALDGCAWLRPPSARSSAEDKELPPALNRRAAGDGQAGAGRDATGEVEQVKAKSAAKSNKQEVVADGVADDHEWNSPFERPDVTTAAAAAAVLLLLLLRP
jgi:hypothetical protein